MEAILDYHLHSRFSRACSPKLTLFNIEFARSAFDSCNTLYYSSYVTYSI